MPKGLLLLCFFLFMYMSAAKGQQPVFVHYTIKDELSSNKIYSIHQSPDGYIWIATGNGVCRFDGAIFRCFTAADGLPTNDVFSVFPGPAGKIWLQDFNTSTHYLQNDSLHTIAPIPLPQKIFPVANPDNDEKICLSGFNNGEYCKLYITKERVRSNPFYSYVSREVKKGEIIYCDFERAVIRDADKLWLVERNKLRSFPVDQEIMKRLHYLLTDNMPFLFSNKVFFKIGPATYLYIDCKRHHMVKLDIRAMSSIKTIAAKHLNHSISFTTDKGLIVIDTNMKVIDSFPIPSMLSHNNISEMFKDRSGNIWIGTRNDGIYLIPAFYRDMQQREKMSAGNIIKCVDIGSRQYGMNDAGNLIEFEQGTYRRTIRLPDVIHPERPPENITLLPDKHDGLYIASIKGMFYLNHRGSLINMLSRSRLPKRQEPGSFKDAFYDGTDDRYYFSLYDKLCSYNTISGMDTGIIKGRYNHIAIPRENELWLANDNGITSWKKETIKGTVLLTAPNQVSKYQVSDMITDPMGNVIVQAKGKGAFVFERNKTVPYSLPEKTIQMIKMSKSGLWMVSDKGLKLFTLQNNHYCVKRYIPNIKGILYDEVYDLLTDSTEMTLITKNGILYIPLTNENYNDPYFSERPGVSIDYAHVTYPSGEVWKGNWEKSDLTFKFKTNSASYLGNISYEYYLEGIDFFLHSTSSPTVSYPLLPPGDYTFYVRARVNETNIISAKSTVRLTIMPRWWQSLWLKVGLALLSVVCLCLFFEWRLRRTRHKMQLQAHLKSKAAQMELQALQSQMNPHFIFNALGAIRSHFKFNKIPEAEQLLEDFAQLIRMYLEFSKSQLIPLQQELAALQLYTDIERNRFDNKFRVVFGIRKSLNNNVQWQIPPMILQPIVENAINHGLYRKPGRDGLLRIFFLGSNETLTVIIDDNGIGRIRAAEINSKIPRPYPSRGNSLIADRIHVLKMSGKINITHEIIDKYDRENTVSGTRVIIRFS